MNHIYKVIFNKATGTFMAVAEYAKSHSTGGSCATGQVGSVRTLSFARVAALAVLVIGATLSGSAYATTFATNTKIKGGAGDAKATGKESIAIGGVAEATGSQAIAIGSNELDNGTGRHRVGPKAIGSESIAIGGDVSAEGHASIAIGSDDLYLPSQLKQNDAFSQLIRNHEILSRIQEPNSPIKYRRTTAKGHASTAVGAMSYAQGHFSNAFGTYATAEAAYSLAVGLAAQATKQSSIAVGSNAKANQLGAIAIGANTQANIKGSIAIGQGSQVNNNNNDNNKNAYIPTANSQPSVSQNNYKATDNAGPLSIGSNSIKRRIIHVGAGSQDTDAVNVAQLKKAVELANRKITFEGDGSNNNEVLKGLGDTLTIKGGETESSKLANGNNIGVVKDNNNSGLKVKLAQNLSGLKTVRTESLTASEKVTVGTTLLTKDKIGFAGTGDRVDENKPYLDNEKLKVGNSTLNKSGLTVNNTTDNKRIQVGADGIKFADMGSASDAAPVAVGTTRITRDKIGFAGAGAGDGVDANLPHLSKDGINAGRQKITELANGTDDTDAVTIQQLKAAKPTLTAGHGISITNGDNNGNLVGNNGMVTAPTYDISVKTTTLTSAGSGKNKFTVSSTGKNDSLVTAQKLAEYLNQVNGTADSALQNFKVQSDDDSTSAITVAKNNNTLKLKGKDGLTVATSQDGTVTFGLAQKNGLTVGKSTLNDSGLTVKNNNEQIQVGANGIEFTAVNNNGAGAGIENTARITRDKIGFTGANGLLDESKPHLSLTGINAGGKAITNLPKLLTDATDSSTGHVSEIKGLPAGSDSDIDKSKAASITDVLNAGFNLQGNDKAVDFVSTYDTVNFIDGNATTAKVTYNDKTSKVTYNVNVDNKTIELTGDNGTKNKIGVKTIKLTETSTNGNATTFSTDDDHALVKASDIAGNLNTLAEEIHTTKGTADTALQTFTVKKVDENDKADDTNAITVGKDGTSGKVNTLKLKGKNGLDIKTDKDGTVTFGINTQSGLKAGDSTTLNNNGLSIKNTASNEQIQVGADGVKFAMVNNGVVGAGIDGTTRITRDEIGFTGTNGSLDKSKPHLSKDGINAGGKKITNIQSGEIAQNSHDAVTGGKIYDLKTELENKISSTAKTAQNSLHEFSVADEQGNNFTVSNPYSSYDTSKTSDVITFAGENGITTKVNKGVVRVGIDQTKGLTTPKLTVGNNNGKGIVIDSQNGQNTITGLSNTLANVTNDKGSVRTTEQGKIIKDEDKTRAASIVDVLSAGFNLQGNGEAVDFVSTYDTVNFADGNATTAKVTYDDTSKTSKVVYDVNVDDTTIEVKDKKLGVKTTTLTSTGTGANKFALSNQATGDALVKASDIVAHLNTLSGDIQTAKGASQANSSAGYVDADGNKVIYDSTDNKYYQAKNDGTVDKTKEVAKDKLVAQAQTPDGTLAQMNVKSVINKEQVNDANKKQGINEDNAFVKGLEKAASDNKTKNAAVTVGDLNAVAQTPLTFAGDTGTTAKKLGETLTIKGGQTDTNKLTDNNIGVVAGTDGFTVKLAKDLTNLNSVNAGGTKIDDKGVSFVDSSGQAKANTPVLSQWAGPGWQGHQQCGQRHKRHRRCQCTTVKRSTQLVGSW